MEVPLSAAAIRERPPQLELVGAPRVPPLRGGPAAAPTTNRPGAARGLSAWQRAIADRRRAVEPNRRCWRQRFIHSASKTAA